MNKLESNQISLLITYDAGEGAYEYVAEYGGVIAKTFCSEHVNAVILALEGIEADIKADNACEDILICLEDNGFEH